MTKNHLIHKYFQKAHLLTVKNQSYQKTISSLFQWLTDSDGVKNDITTKSLKINKQVTAKIICRDNHAVLSGMEELQFLLSEFTKGSFLNNPDDYLGIRPFVAHPKCQRYFGVRPKLDFTPLKKDKSILSKNEVVAKLKGDASTILSYERTILNILQRMSGISTNTYHFINTINKLRNNINNTHSSDSMNMCYNFMTPYIAATRKTPWMWLDKKAVAAGGGLTHRLNLSDGILIKDNHLTLINKAIKTPREWQAGAIAETMTLAMVKESEELIEIEVETEQQAFAVVKCHTELDSASHSIAIMLDNFTPKTAKQTIQNLKKEFDLSSIIIEASGGIDENNILEWSKTGVDIISLGSLTHSSKASNFSLEI